MRLLSAIFFLWGGIALGSPFRLHLTVEPSALDPHKQKSAASSFVTQNLFRNLYYVGEHDELVLELAKSCKRERHRLSCVLKDHLVWSDGQALTAKDFISAYLRVLDPKTQSLHADSLFDVKNARDVYEGRKKPSELGVTAKDETHLEFEFMNAAPDFEYRLANSLLAPYRENFASPEKMPVTGPYKISVWKKGERLVLTKNEKYPGGNSSRPDVEFRFVEEDSVALKLYEKGQLDFLRRLPTAYIPKYQSSSEFHWVPVLHLDYIGFGPKVSMKLREALALSLDYPELQKIFHSEGTPGCPGAPDFWFTEKMPCFTLDVKHAKTLIEGEKTGTLKYSFSALGGEDHKRATEWEQEQWNHNLNIQVRLKATENKIFLSELKTDPPDLFRKGIAADRPTCLALLENLLPDHADEPTIHDDDFVKAVEPMLTSNDEAVQKRQCEKAIRILMSHHDLIPLGRWSYAILAKPGYSGWRFNGLGQLDLSQLH